MKPSPFDYHDPTTIDEALELLRRYGPEAKILAGGQSLIALMNFRLSAPAALIDLNRVAELSYLRQENGTLRFGSMLRQRTIEFSPVVLQRLPLLAEATRLVGHLPTRTRGTIGGSLAHADPAAEYPTVITALDGELVLRGSLGDRVVGAHDFFQGLMSTALGPDEILVEVRLAEAPPNSGCAFEEFSRRHGDFAIVAVAAMVVVDGARYRVARLAAAGVGPTPMRLRAAEEILEREGLSERAINDAATSAAEIVEPAGDLHASADFRRHLTRVLTRRALARATDRARGK